MPSSCSRRRHGSVALSTHENHRTEGSQLCEYCSAATGSWYLFCRYMLMTEERGATFLAVPVAACALVMLRSMLRHSDAKLLRSACWTVVAMAATWAAAGTALIVANGSFAHVLVAVRSGTPVMLAIFTLPAMVALLSTRRNPERAVHTSP